MIYRISVCAAMMKVRPVRTQRQCGSKRFDISLRRLPYKVICGDGVRTSPAILSNCRNAHRGLFITNIHMRFLAPLPCVLTGSPCNDELPPSLAHYYSGHSVCSVGHYLVRTLNILLERVKTPTVKAVHN